MMYKTRVLALAASAAFATSMTLAAPAVASPDQEVFDQNDNAWSCEEEFPLPANHCINVRSQGSTGVIKVFEPDPRWPQESISFDPRSDTRPCPHDPAATDGTWWEVLPGAWVCHHRP